MPGISVIVTVLNDREALAELLPALAAQRRVPDELVVADAGSGDGTRELLDAWASEAPFPVRVLSTPGAGISAGRNRAIEAAAHNWIACTDAGCAPVPRWLAEIEDAARNAQFVAGIYAVDARTEFERAQAVALYPDPAEVEAARGLVRGWQRLFGKRYYADRATGRSMAFHRDVWRAVGGFPEDMPTGEDIFFSGRASELGFRVVLAHRAVVHWRPRPTWRASARMFHAYARGDIRLGSPSRHLLRLAAWGGGPAVVLLGGRTSRSLVLVGVLAYLALPLARARRTGLRVVAWWRIPALIALKDLSQLCGAITGLVADRRADQVSPCRPAGD